ncbi:hypothetical protein JD844_031672 [Phrynosoma platyrhinos]|uniref:Tetratricopeptide repeat protein 36 n=1 Tax=Phrynosoma platyrhinos TaxID=52577 RepID=A0ABQ7T105_PHRPL|nr:hypothetical protein JD844_031672 [Phrynosoma platyrhinos]
MELEVQGVSQAEAGDLEKALATFGQAIQLLPERASAYNNRAQALRLKGDVAGALEDLDTALRLSKGTGSVACQGFVQRGLIRRLQGQEEEALGDFEQAARLGSAFARQQLVQMNPYAALCNQMLDSSNLKPRGLPRVPRASISLPANLQLNDLTGQEKRAGDAPVEGEEERALSEPENSLVLVERGLGHFPMVGYIYRASNMSSDEIWL